MNEYESTGHVKGTGSQGEAVVESGTGNSPLTPAEIRDLVALHRRSRKTPRRTSKDALILLLLLAIACWVAVSHWRQAQLREPADAAVVQLNSDPDVARLLGRPVTLSGRLSGSSRLDSFGEKYADLTMYVRGPLAEGTVHAVGAKSSGVWVFASLDLVAGSAHKAVNLVSGRVFQLDNDNRVAIALDHERQEARSGRTSLTGKHPCLYTTIVSDDKTVTTLGECSTPTGPSGPPLDRFEVDLRYGSFVLRETDLYLKDVFDVPLTRTYTSDDWLGQNHVHAFGVNTNHPFDIAPLGTRNPYTWQMIAMEDGDFLMFDRVSAGTTYGDAVFRHTETATRFHDAVHAWNGNGWTTELADGSMIVFPESYGGKSLAQGAPTMIRDASGRPLQLKRDAQGNLTEILTPGGHWIKLQYDRSSRIVRADDDQQNWSKYSYNSSGLLTDVTRSHGRQRHFTYDGAKLTSIRDEHFRLILRNEYDGGLLTRQELGNGQTYTFSYRSLKHYAQAATVTFPDRRQKSVEVGNTVPAYVKHIH